MTLTGKIKTPFSNPTIRRLTDLKEGEEAIIHSFESDLLFLKLMEMGCLPGEKIFVEKIAPLGDPVSITVSGYTLCLRVDEATLILVEQNKSE